MVKSPPDLTVLFARLRSGDGDALGDIMDALYTELHALAARRMRDENRQHTLQPTALVNEAYLRLVRGPVRFFGGHTDNEVSKILGEHVSAIRRDWTFARSWLKTHLAPVATA